MEGHVKYMCTSLSLVGRQILADRLILWLVWQLLIDSIKSRFRHLQQLLPFVSIYLRVSRLSNISNKKNVEKG